VAAVVTGGANGGLDETGQQKTRAGPEDTSEDVNHAQDEKQVEHEDLSLASRTKRKADGQPV
jgi:hypothetical protein